MNLYYLSFPLWSVYYGKADDWPFYVAAVAAGLGGLG